MRDLETIQLALTAAETGHLSLPHFTLQRAENRRRIIDAFPPNQQSQIRTQLAEALEAVITQTLLKKNQAACRRPRNLGRHDRVRNLIERASCTRFPESCRPVRKTACKTMDMRCSI